MAQRLLWASRLISAGHQVHISTSVSRASGKLKLKLLIEPIVDVVPSFFRPILLRQIDTFIRLAREDGTTSVDRGHKHSTGISEVACWFSTTPYSDDSCVEEPPPPPPPPLEVLCAIQAASAEDGCSSEGQPKRRRLDDSSCIDLYEFIGETTPMVDRLGPVDVGCMTDSEVVEQTFSIPQLKEAMMYAQHEQAGLSMKYILDKIEEQLVQVEALRGVNFQNMPSEQIVKFIREVILGDIRKSIG